MVCHIDWFVYIEESLYPWDPTILVWFLYCVIGFCLLVILLKIFVSMLISDIGLLIVI